MKRHGVGILTVGLATALLSATFANNTLFNNDKVLLLGTVTVTLNSVAPNATVQINYNSNTSNTTAGVFNLTTTAPQNQAFCVDLVTLSTSIRTTRTSSDWLTVASARCCT